MPLTTQTVLTIGPVHTLTQNTVYCLPTRVHHIRTSVAVEVSLQETTAFAILTNSTNGVENDAVYVRCTTGTALLVLKTH